MHYHQLSGNFPSHKKNLLIKEEFKKFWKYIKDLILIQIQF